MLILCLVIITCALLWRLFKHKRSDGEPPEYPGALPLLGHLHLIVGSSAKFWNTFKKSSHHCLENGGVTSLNFGLHKDYLIADPDDALTVANACMDKHFLYDFAKPWLGNGLVTATGAVWKTHRKMLNPIFHQQSMYGYFDVFNKQARRLVEALGEFTDQGPFEFMPYIYKNALDTICETTLDFDVGDSVDIKNKYIDAAEKMTGIVFKRYKEPWLYFDTIFRWSGLKKLQDIYLQILHNEVNQILQRRRSELKLKMEKQKDQTIEEVPTRETKGNTFLEVLLDRCSSFTDQEVKEHVDTTVVSGYETTGTVMVFTTLLIGSYPHVQERLFDELRNVFGDSDRDVTKDDLSRLTYLDAVIKESLRTHPVTPGIARKIDRDVKLKEFTLRSGNSCIISLYGIHRNSIWGADADEFKPERWLDRSTLPANPNAFVSFSLGKRLCIGKAYAMLSLKTKLVHLLRNFKVSSDRKKMALEMDIFLKPAPGHQISIDRRKNCK